MMSFLLAYFHWIYLVGLLIAILCFSSCSCFIVRGILQMLGEVGDRTRRIEEALASEPKAVGYWVVIADDTGELMQWGINNGMDHPFTTFDEAWAQGLFIVLHEVDTQSHFRVDIQRDTRPFVLTVFTNGEINLDEVVEGFKPEEETEGVQPQC